MAPSPIPANRKSQLRATSGQAGLTGRGPRQGQSYHWGHSCLHQCKTSFIRVQPVVRRIWSHRPSRVHQGRVVVGQQEIPFEGQAANSVVDFTNDRRRAQHCAAHRELLRVEGVIVHRTT